MHKVVIDTAETSSTIEATDRLVKILNINYVKANHNNVADNTTQQNAEERTQLLRLLEDIEDLFGGTLGYWGTELVDLELKLYSKPFNCKYHPVPRNNKETFCKDSKCLFKRRLLTTVQKISFGTPVFIIPKKEETVRFIIDYCRLKYQLVIKTYPLPIIG